MKKVFGLVVLMMMTMSSFLYAQDEKKDEKATEVLPGPAITFEETTHDFGDIFQGDKVSYVFKFENTGDEPLIITDVRVTCGCTVPDWPRDPIAPGESASLTVKFNSAGKKGRQNKVISVVSNSVSPVNQVTITSNVLIKDKDTE